MDHFQCRILICSSRRWEFRLWTSTIHKWNVTARSTWVDEKGVGLSFSTTQNSEYFWLRVLTANYFKVTVRLFFASQFSLFSSFQWTVSVYRVHQSRNNVLFLSSPWPDAPGTIPYPAPTVFAGSSPRNSRINQWVPPRVIEREKCVRMPGAEAKEQHS